MLSQGPHYAVLGKNDDIVRLFVWKSLRSRIPRCVVHNNPQIPFFLILNALFKTNRTICLVRRRMAEAKNTLKFSTGFQQFFFAKKQILLVCQILFHCSTFNVTKHEKFFRKALNSYFFKPTFLLTPKTFWVLPLDCAQNNCKDWRHLLTLFEAA